MKIYEKMCIADFDDTLIRTDSLAYIMKREKWYLRPVLIAAGIGIIAGKLLPGGRSARRGLSARSRFKKQLLKYYYLLSAEKHDAYISAIRQKLNTSVIEAINEKEYDRIVIVSASETGLIREVMDDIWPDAIIIANTLGSNAPAPDTAAAADTSESTDNFTTCYGAEKVRRLAESIPDYKDYEISVYTGSMSDKPLIDIATEAYMVDGHRLTYIDNRDDRES